MQALHTKADQYDAVAARYFELRGELAGVLQAVAEGSATTHTAETVDALVSRYDRQRILYELQLVRARLEKAVGEAQQEALTAHMELQAEVNEALAAQEHGIRAAEEENTRRRTQARARRAVEQEAGPVPSVAASAAASARLTEEIAQLATAVADLQLEWERVSARVDAAGAVWRAHA